MTQRHAGISQRYSLASSIIGWGTPVLVLVALCVVLFDQPFATNDGPVHISFANLMANLSEPWRELQRMTYVVDLRPLPNVTGYLLMAPLTKVMSAQAVESAMQILCLFLPAAAAWLAFRTIRRENAWLAIFVLPLSLNQNLFLGLYNCCLSIAMVFVAMALYWRLNERPTIWRGIILGLVLSLALLTHAAGFVAAQTGVATLAAVHAFRRWRRGSPPGNAVYDQRFAWLALSVPVALFIATLPVGSRGDVEFGPMPWVRLAYAARLELLRLSGGTDAITALALSLVLGSTFMWTLVNFLRRKDELGAPAVDAMHATLAALGVSILVLMFFPDTMGGGWTHARRFAILPFFWLLAAIAFHRFNQRLKLVLMIVAAIATFILYGATFHRESIIRQQMAPLVEADGHIGTHCTVLPVVLQSKPLDSASAPRNISYNPFFQAASRFELNEDRVVLFNYLARLDIYPIKFRSQFEPQANLFHWESMQQDANDREGLDTAGFEKHSGLRVDYVLLVGSDPNESLALRKRIADSLSGARLVYQSADQHIQLFERQAAGSPSSRCVRRKVGD